MQTGVSLERTASDGSEPRINRRFNAYTRSQMRESESTRRYVAKNGELQVRMSNMEGKSSEVK